MKKVVVGIISRMNEAGKTEFLLVSSRKDFGERTGLFYPPGGKVEGEETEGAALIREIQEELHLKVEPVKKIAETGGDIAEQKTHWWQCEVADLSLLQINTAEIAEVRWWTKEAIVASGAVWPATKKFFEQFI